MSRRSQIRMTLDENSDIVSAQDYYPYGEILRSYTLGSGVNNKYYFTEKERDTETNYDYFGARFYDSELARWLQVDPLADKYPSWSPYNYCFNNPLIIIDPDGMDTTTVSAEICYDFNSGREIINETIVEHLNTGTEDFAIITATTTATIYADGGVNYSKVMTSFTKSGVITVNNANVNIKNFSEKTEQVINRALELKESTGFGFLQSQSREFNSVVKDQANLILLYNLTTTIALPMSWTKNTMVVDAINIGNSEYNIFNSLYPTTINTNGNLVQSIYKR